MKRGEDLGWSHVKVGILLFVSFLILLWVAFNSDLGAIFEEEERLTARLPSAEGLVSDSPVRFLGLETGSVQSVRLVPGAPSAPIRMVFSVEPAIRSELRADAYVRVASLGVLGDKYLELVRGDDPRPLLPERELRARPQTALTDLLEPGRRSLTRVDTLLANLEAISGDVRAGRGSLGKLLEEDELHARLLSTLEETRLTLADFRRTQSMVGAQVAAAVGALDSLATGFRTGEGTLNRLAEDPALYENLNAASQRLERVLAEVERGDGLLARLLRDPEFADQTTGLVVDLRTLLQDMRENPGRYVQFSVF